MTLNTSRLEFGMLGFGNLTDPLNDLAFDVVDLRGLLGHRVHRFSELFGERFHA